MVFGLQGAFCIEEIPGVKIVVAEKLKRTAVVIVRTALSDHVNGGAGAAALFDPKEIGLDLELQNVLDGRTQRDHCIAAKVVVHAVEQDIVGHLTVAVHHELSTGARVVWTRATADGAGGPIAHADCPSSENRKLSEIAAVQRHIGHGFRFDHLADLGSARFESRRGAGHFDSFGDRSGRQRDIHSRNLIDLEPDSLPSDRGEARLLNCQPVAAWQERGELVGARLIR